MSMQVQNVSHIVSIVVCGAAGRMGSRVCALAAADARFHLLAAVTRHGSPRLGQPVVPGSSVENTQYQADFPRKHPDVVIDFSTDQGARAARDYALLARAALLVGTTALSEETLEALRRASKTIPVLLAPNTALGVCALADAARRLARSLGPAFDISIIEAHHAAKKDAPSGTALRLADALADAGAPIPRHRILSIRGGDTIGEHTIRYSGPGEEIQLTHRATSRDLFALGALRAAAWLKGRAPAMWSIEDTLNIAAS